MLRDRLFGFLVMSVLLVLAGCSGQGQSRGEGGLLSVGHYLEDGTITDGELEQVWRLAEECLRARGVSASAEKDGWGYWNVSWGGELRESDYEDCTEVSWEVRRLYWVERIPEGAERLELAESLAECFASVGIELVYDPNAPDKPSVWRSVWEQFGYELDDSRIFEDPRFPVVSDCMITHELLFPHRFDPIE